MHRKFIAVLVFLFPLIAHAQTPKMVVGGVDLREWPLREQYLSQLEAQRAQQGAELAAKLQLLQQDADAAQKANAWYAKCLADPVCVTWANSKKTTP